MLAELLDGAREKLSLGVSGVDSGGEAAGKEIGWVLKRSVTDGPSLFFERL